MLMAPVETFDSPVTFGLSRTVHVYVVFAGTIPFVPLAGVSVNVSLLQMVADIAVIAGLGFTLTIN